VTGRTPRGAAPLRERDVARIEFYTATYEVVQPLYLHDVDL
jgi:hypothetical protein